MLFSPCDCYKSATKVFFSELEFIATRGGEEEEDEEEKEEE
jgi:hypothetical protein